MFDYLKQLLIELRSLNKNLQEHGNAIADAAKATKTEPYVTPEVRALLNFPESVQADKKASDQRNERYQKRNLVVAWITFVTLLVYAITTIGIYIATYHAAEAATNAAIAAKNAVNVAREAGRPWIGPMRAKPVRTASGFNVTIEFKNGGIRPARIISAKSSGHLYDVFPENPDYGQNAIKQSRQIMVGNKPGFFQFDFPVDAMAMKDMERGRKTLYFYAIVNYEDVSGNGKHTTKMCWFYIPKSRDTGSCPEYNDAD